LQRIGEIRERIEAGIAGSYAFEPLEAANLVLVSEAMARASLAREESRGAHRRRDYPAHRPEFARRHTSVRLNAAGALDVTFVPCRDAAPQEAFAVR
jgi:succinate dehydrogenase/fumarate reductase flavoprotein subunit